MNKTNKTKQIKKNIACRRPTSLILHLLGWYAQSTNQFIYIFSGLLRHFVPRNDAIVVMPEPRKRFAVMLNSFQHLMCVRGPEISGILYGHSPVSGNRNEYSRRLMSDRFELKEFQDSSGRQYNMCP